jgi:catechol 2,3-dioxygenase-like lactoylglutathione lyase family enzyme
MAILGMDHFTILTDDVEATREFYGDILGFTPGWRPGFKFPGMWLYSGERPILHVIGGKAREDLRSGVLDHMAFTATDLKSYVAKLKERGIAYDLRRLGGAPDGAWQLFFFDPNNARVELDFDGAEPGPA